jgi:ABC-type uncharacterized transport system substrate-binding protein
LTGGRAIWRVAICRRVILTALAAGCTAFYATDLSAHPHVFIDNRVTFLFAGKKLVGFRENWLFDDVFSDQLMQEYDADSDGKIGPAESDKLGKETLPNLAQFHYFTYIWADGKALPKITPTDFHASAKDKLVTFDFLVTLPQPIDPASVALEVNDREYFVEVLLAKDQPIFFRDKAGKELAGLACKANVAKDEKNAYYGGFVYPQRITLACQ